MIFAGIGAEKVRQCIRRADLFFGRRGPSAWDDWQAGVGRSR